MWTQYIAKGRNEYKNYINCKQFEISVLFTYIFAICTILISCLTFAQILESCAKFLCKSVVDVYVTPASQPTAASTLAFLRWHNSRRSTHTAGSDLRTTTATAVAPTATAATPTTIHHCHAAPEFAYANLHRCAWGRGVRRHTSYGETRKYRMTIGIAQSRRYGSVNLTLIFSKST